MTIVSFPKGTRALLSRLSPNFRAREFDCPCNQCSYTFVDLELVEKLQKMRDALGVPIGITSGYRCDAKQARLKEEGFETAEKRSTHQDGRAADIWTGKHSGAELERAARAAGFKSVGVGQGWIHVDVRPKERRWVYSVRSAERVG